MHVCVGMCVCVLLCGCVCVCVRVVAGVSRTVKQITAAGAQGHAFLLHLRGACVCACVCVVASLQLLICCRTQSRGFLGL